MTQDETMHGTITHVYLMMVDAAASEVKGSELFKLSGLQIE